MYGVSSLQVHTGVLADVVHHINYGHFHSFIQPEKVYDLAGRPLCLLISTCRVSDVPSLSESLSNGSSLWGNPLRLFMKAQCLMISGVLWVYDEDWCTWLDLGSFCPVSFSVPLTVQPIFLIPLKSNISSVKERGEIQGQEERDGRGKKCYFVSIFCLWYCSHLRLEPQDHFVTWEIKRCWERKGEREQEKVLLDCSNS